MANTKKKETPKEDNRTESQKVLDAAYDLDYLTMVVVGVLPGGMIDLRTTHPNYGNIHHVLNKALFETTLMERESNIQKLKETEKSD